MSYVITHHFKANRNAIEKQNYAVLGNRPSISKPRKLALVARAAMAKLFGTRLGGKQ